VEPLRFGGDFVFTALATTLAWDAAMGDADARSFAWWSGMYGMANQITVPVPVDDAVL
jgi:hypothetical protein